MPELSPVEARDKFDQLRAQFDRYHKQVRENRRYYDLDFENEVIAPEAQAQGFIPVIPRTARRTVDEAADHILTHPKIRVPVRPTESDLVTQQEIAEKKRKALSAYWRQVEQRYNIIGDGKKWLILDGAVAIRHTINWDLIPDLPKRRTRKAMDRYRRLLAQLGAYGFLWNDEVLNTEWVFVDPSNHRDPAYVYVHYTIRAEEAKRRFPDATGEWRNLPDYEKVNYFEYWSAPKFTAEGWEPGKHYEWVDRESVNQDENPYPYVPVAVEDSGWGLVHASSDPHEKFVGLNQFSHSVFVAQARQWSALEAVTENTAFNPLIARNLSPEKIAQLRVGPGAVWDLEGAPGDPDSESLEFAQYPPIPVTVLQILSLIDREVNGALKTDTLGGIPQTGVDTATEADQNVRNAAAKLTGPVAALERLVAKISRWVLMDIELVLEAPVTLYAVAGDDAADVRLTPRDIGGYYDVDVSLRTADEEALSLTRARFWGDMYRVLPFLSAWTAMERGEIADDPMKEMLRRSAEDVYLSDEFIAIRKLTGAQSFGELATALEAMMQGGNGNSTANAGPASDENLVQQDEITSPVQARVVNDAFAARDVNQMGAAGRGP